MHHQPKILKKTKKKVVTSADVQLSAQNLVESKEILQLSYKKAYLCNVPDTAEPYFPISFACLHKPECLSHVTCKAAKISNPKLVQHFPSHAAHEVKELPKNRNNLANNDVYKPTLCQAYCWCWVHYIKMLQKEQCLSTPHPFGTFVAPLVKKLCSTLTQSWKPNYSNQCVCANITITFLFVAARFKWLLQW